MKTKKATALLPQSSDPVAAIYCRVSTDEQADRGTIATQTDFARRYIEQTGITVYDTYADNGVSGTVPFGNRPEGARLLADARAGRFNRVLVYRLDRLGRKVRVILDAVAELDTAGVALRSMTEPFETETPAGRMMLTLLASFSEFEKDSITDRSIEGIYRCAREGAWVGGIAPYGYRVVGEHHHSRIIVSNELIEGQAWSEADVVRFMYRSLAADGRSCVWVADELNRRGVPPAYTRDGRDVLRNKRKAATAGVWRASRVRNLIVSTTYKGVHEFGKRGTRRRETVTRDVPAIVTADVWEAAQVQLERNLLFSPRNATRQYLLRGVVKCGDCGLTYIGTVNPGKDGPRPYYVCSGKHGAGRGKYGLLGQRCPAKSLRGDGVEEAVWSDLEAFLRDPRPVLEQLEEQMRGEDGQASRLAEDAERVSKLLNAKEAERSRVVTLYRRGVIDDAALDAQLTAITQEEAALKEEAARLRDGVRSAEATRARLRTAEDLLRDLNARLDGPLTWEKKREVVEALVERVTVQTIGDIDLPQQKKQAVVTVRYRFAPSTLPIANYGYTGSSRRQG